MTAQRLLRRSCRIVTLSLLAAALAFTAAGLPGCGESEADRRAARERELDEQAQKVREERRELDEMAREAAEEEAREAARRTGERLEKLGEEMQREAERPDRPGT